MANSYNSKLSHSWQDPLSDFDNVVDLLESRAEEHGDRTFGTFPEDTLSVRELKDRSAQLAAGLAARGVEPGDRVAAMMNNHHKFAELFFAVARTGGIFVPINVSLRGDDLVYALDDADPELVAVGPDCMGKFREIEDEFDFASLLSIGSGEDGFELIEDVYKDASAPTAQLSPADPLAMIYTSGTTGMPKGVVLPHGAYLSVATELAERIVQPTPNDVLYMSQPLFHIFGQVVMMEGVMAGTPIAMERRFSKSKFWQRVKKHEATVIHFSTAIAEILYNKTESPDNPVRVAIGAIADEIQESFCEKFDCQVVPLYGLTESGGLALSGTVDEPHIGSLGRPLRYTDVEIVDEQDNPVDPNEHGEIVVRPTRPNCLFQEYHEKPSATVETLRNHWLHTGDIGYRDKDGDFHFVERKSYFIRRKGENVSAFEVERIINDHPGVEKAVVAGADSELGGEEVFAAIELKAGENLEPLDIIQHCEGRLAYFKIPRYVVFVDDFPTTGTKETVQRHKLLEEHLANAWDLEDQDYELEK